MAVSFRLPRIPEELRQAFDDLEKVRLERQSYVDQLESISSFSWSSNDDSIIVFTKRPDKLFFEKIQKLDLYKLDDYLAKWQAHIDLNAEFCMKIIGMRKKYLRKLSCGPNCSHAVPCSFSSAADLLKFYQLEAILLKKKREMQNDYVTICEIYRLRAARFCELIIQ